MYTNLKCFRMTLKGFSVSSSLDDLYGSVSILTSVCCFTHMLPRWALTELTAGGQHYESHYKSSKNSNKEGATEAQMVENCTSSTRAVGLILRDWMCAVRNICQMNKCQSNDRIQYIHQLSGMIVISKNLSEEHIWVIFHHKNKRKKYLASLLRFLLLL